MSEVFEAPRPTASSTERGVRPAIRSSSLSTTTNRRPISSNERASDRAALPLDRVVALENGRALCVAVGIAGPHIEPCADAEVLVFDLAA